MDWSHVNPWQREQLAKRGVYPPDETPEPKRTVSRSTQGKRAKTSGDSWEETNMAQLAAYKQRGSVAAAHRLHPEFVVQGKHQGKLTGFYRSKAPADVTIAVTNGPTIHGDFKASKTARWPFKSLEEHQANHLTDWQDARQGRVSVLFVRTTEGCWVLPWFELSDRWWAWHKSTSRAASGAASLSTDDMDALGARYDAAGFLGPFMWLWDDDP